MIAGLENQTVFGVITHVDVKILRDPYEHAFKYFRQDRQN